MGRGFTSQELIKGGLAREGRRGPVDRFRGRLIWPIRDITGDVIGFGARKLLDSDDGPKYLNTPESPIYHKSSVLYGVDLAKREIAKRSQAVIVEGYTDVMACHLAGVPTAVATCGTSFGEEHIKVLRRLLLDQAEFRGEVIFTFDGDSAGQKAALRAFQDEQKFVTQTFVAVQPDGLDPCDLRVKQGDAAVRDLIASREPLFAFAIRSTLSRYDLDTNEGRLAALDAAAPIVASIKDPGLRKTYVVDLDRWLGFIDEGFVIQRVQQVVGRAQEGGHAPGRRQAARGAAPARPARHARSPWTPRSAWRRRRSSSPSSGPRCSDRSSTRSARRRSPCPSMSRSTSSSWRRAGPSPGARRTRVGRPAAGAGRRRGARRNRRRSEVARHPVRRRGRPRRRQHRGAVRRGRPGQDPGGRGRPGHRPGEVPAAAAQPGRGAAGVQPAVRRTRGAGTAATRVARTRQRGLNKRPFPDLTVAKHMF